MTNHARPMKKKKAMKKKRIRMLHHTKPTYTPGRTHSDRFSKWADENDAYGHSTGDFT